MKLRTYELLIVFDPSLGEEELEAKLSTVQKHLESVDGVTVTRIDKLGKKKLAYPINKVEEGFYVVLYLRAEKEPPPIREVEFDLRHDEKVLRYITVRTDRDIKRALKFSKSSLPAAEAVKFK